MNLKDYAIVALAGLLLVAGVLGTIQRYKIKALKSNVQALTERDDKWAREMAAMTVELNEALTKVEECSESIDRAAALGIAAQAAQEKADEYAERLTYSEQRMADLEEDNRRFLRLTSTLTVCETYEMVLRSIAGEVIQ